MRARVNMPMHVRPGGRAWRTAVRWTVCVSVAITYVVFVFAAAVVGGS